jgi:dienelactone hydrolase
MKERGAIRAPFLCALLCARACSPSTVLASFSRAHWVQHAFNNDAGGARYDKTAAELAWGRTLAFFAENLGASPKAT